MPLLLRAVALALALAAAHSAFLAPSVRAFVPGYSNGIWVRDEAESSSSCPKTIDHKAYRRTNDPSVFLVQHRDMFHDLTECLGRGDLAMIASPALLNASLFDGASPLVRRATRLDLVGDETYMSTAREIAATGNTFYALVELTVRVCGATARFEKGTQGFFLANGLNDEPFSVPPFTKKFEATKKHMALFEPGAGGRRCLYSAEIGSATPPPPTNARPTVRRTPEPEPVEPTPTPKAVPTPTPTPAAAAPGGGTGNVFGDITAADEAPPRRRVCFPASATVQLRDGHIARMDELQLGDEVHVGGGAYSRVFLFTHRAPGGRHPFVRITAASGHVLRASATHLAYIAGRLRPMSAAAVGDELVLADGSRSRVAAVAQEVAAGLYNPQTAHGDIAVDGVLASCYTAAVPAKAAHPLLAPLRALAAAAACRVGSA